MQECRKKPISADEMEDLLTHCVWCKSTELVGQPYVLYAHVSDMFACELGIVEAAEKGSKQREYD